MTGAIASKNASESSPVSVASAAIGYFANGEEITIRTTLLTLALDILVLLALSSRDARAWARRPRRRKG